jgi:GntR family transcriptional regulator
MDIRLSRGGGTPAYLQIVDQIKHHMATGRLQPGQQLPTIRQLAADLGVNRNTVARAYKELAREGVISTRQGRGTFVSERPNQLLLARMRREKLGAIFSKPFVEALSLGYSMQEIEEAVIEQLTHWWAETQRPDSG